MASPASSPEEARLLNKHDSVIAWLRAAKAPQTQAQEGEEQQYVGSYRYRGYASNAFHPGRYFRTNHSYQQRRWPGTFGSNKNGAYPINQSENIPQKPKVITIVRNGAKPRHNVKILLNRRSVQSYEQLLSDISEAFGPKFRQNKVRRLFSVRGKEVLGISDFFRDDECFIALGVGESNLADTDVADILEELFPEGQVSKSLLKEWERNQRRRRRVSPTGGASVKSNNNQNLNAVHGADKRDSGFDSSDASTNRSEPDQNGPPGYRKAMQQRRKMQRDRDSERDRDRDKESQSETNSTSPQHGYYLMKKLEKERMKIAAEEKERAKRRQMKMAEAEKRAAEDEKRKRGLIPMKNVNDPFKKGDDAKDKEQQDARRRKEDEKRKKGEEKMEAERRQREKEDRDAAEKAARDRMAQAEREENERQEKERQDKEKRDKEKPEREKRKAEKEDQGKQTKTGKGAPSTTGAGKGKEKESDEVAGVNDSGHGSGENVTDASHSNKNRLDHGRDVLKSNIKQANASASDPGTTANESSGTKDTEQQPQTESQQQQQQQQPSQESQPPTSDNKDAAAAKSKEKRKHEKDDKQQQQQQQQQRKRAKTKIVRRTKAERQVSGDEYITSRYDLGRKLGDGNFAIVRQSRKKETGQEYAVKVIDKAKLKGKEHMVEHEIDIMKDCSHNNIVRLYEEYETAERIYLVMELVKGGDLFDAITQSVKFGEVDSSLMVRDLCNALFYLHSRSIVHRDLKPENLLVHRNKDGSITLKLADFGLAMEVKEHIYTVCGTPTYVAPEILTEIGYGLEVDMWAVGVITYILLCGFPPFRSPDRNQTELFEFIKAGEYEFLSPYWDNTSRSAKDLIQHLLIVDRRKRFTAVDVLSHKWVVCTGDTDTLPEGALTVDSACKETRKELEAQARANYDSYQRLKEKKRRERAAVEE